MTTPLRGRSKGAYAWGLDCGSSRAGFAFINTNTGEFTVTAIDWRSHNKRLRGARSLQACRARLLPFVEAMAGHFPPVSIGYEKPTGAFPNPSLDHHVGTTIEAVCSATDLEPFPVSVGEWKKAFCGTGAATKQLVMERCEELASGFPLDQEMADALGVAFFVAREQHGLVELSRWLQERAA